jgi:hypothetical protein
MCQGGFVTVDLGWGIGGVIIGGLLNGSWVLPMKRIKAWKWENTWLFISVVGLVIIPWAAAVTTVPKLGRVFLETCWLTLGKVIVFGIG